MNTRKLVVRGNRARAGIGYDSVRNSYYEDNHPVTHDRGSGYFHDRNNRYQQVSMARDLHRNNYLFGAVVNAVLNHLVGDRINIQIRSDNHGFSDAAENYLRDFLSRTPETRNRFKNNQLWRAIATELIVAGEAIVIKTDSGQLQLVESELLGGLGVENVDGIDFDGDAPAQYWLCSYDQWGTPDPSTQTPIKAQHVIHRYHNNRISGVRGIPPMQPIFSLLLYLNDIVKSEAKSWEIISRVALIAKRNDGPMLAFDESESDAMAPRGYVEDWDVARIFHADIGESLSTLERNVPNKNFGETLLEFLRLAGSIFGLPGEFIVANFSRSNYSQSKAATVFAHRGIQYWQEHLRAIIEDVVRWKIDTAFTTNEPPPYTVEVFLPGAIHLDPQKESSALSDRLAGGLTTMSAAVGEYGRDYEELLVERQSEIRKAIGTAKALEAETGVSVPWQLFSGLGNIAGSPRQIDAELQRQDKENED